MQEKGKPETSCGELLRHFGMWFLLSVFGKDFSIRQCWSKNKFDNFQGTPVQLGEYMTRDCFYDITSVLSFTLGVPQFYKDQFLEVHELLFNWNLNMAEQFIALIWLNKWTCPGW